MKTQMNKLKLSKNSLLNKIKKNTKIISNEYI